MTRMLRLFIASFFIFVFFVPGQGLAQSRHQASISVKGLDLSRPPTTLELMTAGQLGGTLYPTTSLDELNTESLQRVRKVGALSASEQYNLTFGRAIEAWNTHDHKKASQMFRELAEAEPNSPWVAEALLHVGCEASYNGRYTEAEDQFSRVHALLKNNDTFGARMMRSKALSRQAELRVVENNREAAFEMFSQLKAESPDWRHRTYAASWILRLAKERHEALALYNCGALALSHVLRRDGKIAEADRVSQLVPQTASGHSLQELQAIAEIYGYPVTAARLAAGDVSRIQMPAVHIQHSNGGHYQVLEDVNNGSLSLFDPQSGTRFSQSVEEFSAAFSGNALVFQDGNDIPGEILDTNALLAVQGSCCGVQRPSGNTGKCDANAMKSENNDPCKQAKEKRGTPVGPVPRHWMIGACRRSKSYQKKYPARRYFLPEKKRVRSAVLSVFSFRSADEKAPLISPSFPSGLLRGEGDALISIIGGFPFLMDNPALSAVRLCRPLGLCGVDRKKSAIEM